MQFSPGCNCCCGPLPGCSRSVESVTLSVNTAGTAPTTITLDPVTCKWVGCTMRTSGVSRPLTTSCGTTNTDGSASQPRVYQMTSLGGLLRQVPMMPCNIGSNWGAAHTSGTCPGDVTGSNLFGPNLTAISGAGPVPPPFVQGQVYTRNDVAVSFTLFSCDPYHGQFAILNHEGTTETVDVTE